MDNKMKRLEYLGKMIQKYSHRWNDYPSDRLTGWVDEYNNIRDNHRQIFYAYCEKHRFAKDHDAYDCLA